MHTFTVFFSWQSDTPSVTNKTFISDALKAAAIKLEFEVQEADRIGIDQGMREVPGSPEVATMMFEKIGESAIFVGDVTLVGTVNRDGSVSKRVPNPNVSIEEGFAAGVLGWERIICVSNEYYGKSEEQPFDTRNRRFPIGYVLSPESLPDIRKKAGARLVRDLLGALKTIQTYELRKARKARDRLDVCILEFMNYHRVLNSFPQPVTTPPESFYDFIRDPAIFARCVMRLIDLGLLHSNLSQDGAHYAYHWTYLGKKVLELIPPTPIEYDD